MKIDGSGHIEDKRILNKVQDMDKNQKLEKRENAQNTESEKDKISLSGKAKEINELRGLIEGLPDIRQDKVDAVKRAVDTGNYNFDPLKLAEKILVEEM